MSIKHHNIITAIEKGNKSNLLGRKIFAWSETQRKILCLICPRNPDEEGLTIGSEARNV